MLRALGSSNATLGGSLVMSARSDSIAEIMPRIPYAPQLHRAHIRTYVSLLILVQDNVFTNGDCRIARIQGVTARPQKTDGILQRKGADAIPMTT